mmetsp:Transcript_1011/g.3127  ORF Transcript_1011/g.3127 Transcript_1011/m.3127 type:complete len:204 (+) Transcript_1011:1382-1993(+)
MSDDALHTLARDHHVNSSALAAGHILVDDVDPGPAKAKCEERAELDYGLLQYPGLQEVLWAPLLAREGALQAGGGALGFLPGDLLLSPELSLRHLHRLERIVADSLHLRHHVFKGIQYKGVGVVCKHHRCCAEHHTHEPRDRKPHYRPGSVEGARVKDEHKMVADKLSRPHCSWIKKIAFNNTKIRRAMDWMVYKSTNLRRQH